MGKYVLKDATIALAETDITSYTREVTVAHSATILDATVLGSVGKEKLAGLTDAELTINGFWDDTDDGVDELSFSRIGSTSFPVTICPEDDDDGDAAIIFQALESEYSPGATVGEMFAFTLSGQGSGILTYGNLLHRGLVSGDSNGTALQLGAVLATEKVYAAFHITAEDAADIDLHIGSDDAVGFPSETPRIVWMNQTEVGSYYATLAGPITDDWWRIVWSITGNSATITVAMAIK